MKYWVGCTITTVSTNLSCDIEIGHLRIGKNEGSDNWEKIGGRLKVEKSVNNPNVPQATKDAYKQSLEQNRMAWKQATSTAQGKQQLESRCKMALDSAKPAFDQYGK